MTENRYRLFDVFARVGASILTVVTLLIGINQYVENSEREFRKEIYSEQMKIYLKTSEIVSAIVNTDKKEIGSPRYDSLRAKFFELKYGHLYLVQDTIVERAFVEFTHLLIRYERKGSKVTTENIQIGALKLNQAFRKSIQKTWDIALPVLNRTKDDTIQ